MLGSVAMLVRFWRDMTSWRKRLLAPVLATTLLLTLPLLIPAHAQPTAATSESTVALPLVVRFSDPNNFELTSATYLGGSGSDSTSGVAIASDGSIVVAGTFPGFTPGGAPPTFTIGSGGDGAIVRFDASGQQVQSITRMGANVTDLELTGSDLIVACGSFGIVQLVADGSTAAWSANPGSVDRCATGSDGLSAALVDQTVTSYTSAGSQVGQWSVSGTATDIAVDSANNLVIVSGWVQITAQLQMPFIRAYSMDGNLQWKSYDFPAGTSNIGTADTRAERLAIGLDGKLYVGFSINGGTGVSVLARDPKNTSQSAASKTVVTDKYTNPFNIGSVSMAWFGRFDPASGNLELGQSLLTRLTSNDRGNSISIDAISADADGRVVIAGDTACCIAERNTRKVAGSTVGNYESGEAYILSVSADFKTRRVWTVFAATGISAGGSPASGVATRAGVVALSATLNPKSGTTRGLITYQALQPALGSSAASDGYMVVAPLP